MGAAAATGPGVEIVATKLHAPAVNTGFVSRDMLVVRLASGVSGRLVLVSAPAGWGKTVLLAQWRHAEEDHRPFAWVSLDPADVDPVRFWSYVIEALRQVAPDFGGALLTALPSAGPRLIEVFMPRLINELAELSEPVVLVLDDYHLLQDELLHQSVGYLLRHAPRTFQLALATRADPPLPLARLRAASEMVELRDLRLSAAETGALLHTRFGVKLKRGTLARLHERIEGWAAAVQLAGLSLSRGADADALLAGEAGILDYLAEEVLLALGALGRIDALGIDVPGDVSVAGFDDIRTASQVTPSLTSVRLPLHELGRRGFLHAERILAGGRPRRQVLPTEVVLRASTARPKPGLETDSRPMAAAS